MKKITLLMIVAVIFIGARHSYGEENASNPLAIVNNTDARLKYFELVDGSERADIFLDGAYMLTPKLKLRYELHYWSTNVTGSSESDWESLRLKPLYFPEQWVGEWGKWKYKWAVGAEWIVDFGHTEQGIGSGSDQIAPFVGMSLTRGDTVLIPFVQHFVEYDGPDVNETRFRLIAIQSFSRNRWGRLDVKVPIDWENDNAIPASLELQLGRMFKPSLGGYVDGLVGIGSDRPYDWGVGVGVRFKY